MTPELIISLIGLVVSVITPLLVWWGATRYFYGSFKEWRDGLDKWKEKVDVKLDNIVAVTGRLDRTEKDIDKLFNRVRR